MSLTCKIQITLNRLSDEKAVAIKKALEPDNINFPKDLSLEIETCEEDVRIYEDQSGRVIEDDIRSGILTGVMLNQTCKDHIAVNSSRLATYATVRKEDIAFSRARRTWVTQPNAGDPNAMQVDAITPKGKGMRNRKGKKGKDKAGAKRGAPPPP